MQWVPVHCRGDDDDERAERNTLKLATPTSNFLLDSEKILIKLTSDQKMNFA